MSIRRKTASALKFVNFQQRNTRQQRIILVIGGRRRGNDCPSVIVAPFLTQNTTDKGRAVSVMAVDWDCNAHGGGISSSTVSDNTPLFPFINPRAVFRRMDTLSDEQGGGNCELRLQDLS